MISSWGMHGSKGYAAMEKMLFWIDSFAGYPAEIVDASRHVYEALYANYVGSFGHRFHFIDSASLRIMTGAQAGLWHDELGNLLEYDGAAYVGLIHPDPVIEERQETIYRLIAAWPHMLLMNYTAAFPMVCKDKFIGIEIARSLGLNVPPTALIDSHCGITGDAATMAAAVGGYPLFIRPNNLTGGMGAQSLADHDELQRFLQVPPFPGKSYLLQPELTIAVDYRVYLEDDRIVGCRARRPMHGKLTTTVDGGGSVAVPEAIQQPSQLLARHLQTRYLCVDWLWNGETYWFCEFETGGGFKDLDQPDRDRVAAAFFGRLLSSADRDQAELRRANQNASEQRCPD